MRPFDPDAPLVFIHVPKTAGASTREVFADWFGPGLIRHYFDEVAGRPPQRDERFAHHGRSAPVCVYGHFNRNRGFGVTDTYPDATQFVTLLRDPFEMACSGYFFTRKVGAIWKDRSRVPTGDLASHLDATAPNMLNHFPCVVTAENYREVIATHFVAIGVTERLGESLQRIATAIGRRFDPTRLPRLNATERPMERPVDGPDLGGLRARYRARHPLEFAVYDHVRWMFDRQGSSRES